VSTPSDEITEVPGCAQPCTTRRAALAIGAAAGAALLTGCATYGGTSDSAAAPIDDPSAADADPSAEPGADGADPSAEAGAGKAKATKPAKPAGVELAKTSEIPVGGGKIFAQKGVVVTQPVAGTFAAFSTVCTHQGCAVEKVENGTINCLCHGSKFKIADGSVAGGPAPKPLARKKVTVDGESLRLV
jgi:Rieske Fe-S protein